MPSISLKWVLRASNCGIVSYSEENYFADFFLTTSRWRLSKFLGKIRIRSPWSKSGSRGIFSTNKITVTVKVLFYSIASHFFTYVWGAVKKLKYSCVRFIRKLIMNTPPPPPPRPGAQTVKVAMTPGRQAQGHSWFTCVPILFLILCFQMSSMYIRRHKPLLYGQKCKHCTGYSSPIVHFKVHMHPG
jgi:hypothetical protein